jgi:tetratricopeptide (TPR) repeat protein
VTAASGSGRGWLALGVALLLLSGAALRAQDVPDTDSSPYHQALLNYKSGNYTAARLAIDDAEKEKPGDPPIEILKARILMELQQYKEANDTLENLNGNPAMTPAYGEARNLAFGDLCLRQRHFDEAAKFYEMILDTKAGDPDIVLKIIYTRVGAGDLVTAGRYASELKPLDPVNPAYYFAKAAIAEATGKASEADEDIQTSRTIYGITVTNHYLKTYLQVTATKPKDGLAPTTEPPPSTNAAPAKTL